jgi:hypothetical protein
MGIADPALLSIGHRYAVILMPLLNLCPTHYEPLPADDAAQSIAC